MLRTSCTASTLTSGVIMRSIIASPTLFPHRKVARRRRPRWFSVYFVLKRARSVGVQLSKWPIAFISATGASSICGVTFTWRAATRRALRRRARICSSFWFAIGAKFTAV